MAFRSPSNGNDRRAAFEVALPRLTRLSGGMRGMGITIRPVSGALIPIDDYTGAFR
jgi:hypothetical protein